MPHHIWMFSKNAVALNIQFTKTPFITMKPFYFLLFTALSMSIASAQNITDGLRYSTESNVGSARFTALSGAMGALGGDLSAMENNPAGGAVFVNSNLTLSGSLTDVKNTSTYFNNSENSFDDRLNLNQVGGIFVFQNFSESSSLKKLTVGVNYQISNNFHNEIFLSGIGNQTIAGFFLAQAQGIPLDNLETQPGESISSLYQYLGETSGTSAQNAFLGYQGYLYDALDPENPQNTSYVSNVAGDRFNHQYLSLTKGYNNKFTVNIAAQVTNDFFFGVNLNTHSLDFRKSEFFVESNNNIGSTINRIGFENNLTAYGAGVSAQIGAIARIANNFRVGLALDTPTWFQITEETSQYLETQRKEDGNNVTAIVDPRVINVFEDYTLKTPGKVTASAAYIFNQNGLISFDYSYKDYSNIKFTPANGSYFDSVNQSIETMLKGASVFRAGAEYRINQISLRGGFHYEESPYKEDKTLGDVMGFSLGTGYNFGNFNVDLAYSRSEQKREIPLYGFELNGQSRVNSTFSNFILSLGFNL